MTNPAEGQQGRDLGCHVHPLFTDLSTEDVDNRYPPTGDKRLRRIVGPSRLAMPDFAPTVRTPTGSNREIDMALLKRKTSPAERARQMASETARQLQTRSRHLVRFNPPARARGPMRFGDLLARSSDYVRRHPLALFGVLISLIGLLGLGMYRRNRY